MSEPKNKQSKIETQSFRRRYKLITAVIILLIIVTIVFVLFTTERKPDPASEKIIREIAASLLNKDLNELTDDDFAKITELTFKKIMSKYKDAAKMFASSASIELYDIKPLEKFTNLQKLDLTWISFPRNRIPVWMKFLEKHGLGDLHGKMTIDLSPLEKLSNLEELKLSGSFIKNIKPLANLTNLKRLEFTNTRVTDLKPIKNLTKLQSLTIEKSPVYHLYPLKSLTNLKALSLYDCNSILYDEIKDLQEALPDLVILRRTTPMIRI